MTAGQVVLRIGMMLLALAVARVMVGAPPRATFPGSPTMPTSTALFRALVLASLLLPASAWAQTRPRGQATVPQTSTYTGPDAGAIATANVAVIIFAANTIQGGCDIINTGSQTLYVDFTTTAVAGSATAIPIQTNQSYHCPFPPTGAVSAVASAAQPFVAVRY